MIRTFKYILILLIFGCSNKDIKEKNINLNINFNTSSTLIIHYQNAPDSSFFETSFYNFFPSDLIENEIILDEKNGIKKLILKIQHPQKIDLSYGEFTTNCFLIPNDTMEIHINLDTTQNIKKSIKYVGKYAVISDYYKNKEVHFNKSESDFNYPKAIAFNSPNTLSEYSSIMDSLTQLELDYINSYKNLLPKWFVDYEITEIKSSTAGSKLIIVPYRRDFLKQDITIPENYFSTIKTFMDDCPNSILSSSYLNYLRNQIQLSHKQNHDTLKPRTDLESHDFFISQSVQNLPKNTSDIFLTKSLDILIGHGSLKDTVYKLYYNAIQNKEFKTYLENRKETGEVLKPEDNAPPFMLPDINGKMNELNDFKGNIVYLTFWFAGCAPCRAEFPDENKLVEKFKGKKVKIINVCTTTSMENWKYVSIKYDLKMINLYANDVLDNFIEKNYDITGYPHHVLIDKEGKIIQNKCARSNKIEEEINKLLNND